MEPTTAATPMEMSDTPTATAPTAATTVATPSAPKPRNPRKKNKWISHVRDYRLTNADRIKSKKLSCGQISKLARESYKPRAKCESCGK